MLPFPIILEIILVLLLIAALLYAAKLNYHVKELRRSRNELESMFVDFGRSTERAERALTGLKEGASENREALVKLINEGRNARQDLEALTNQANRAVGRLETALDKNQVLLNPDHREPQAKAATGASDQDIKRGKANLLKALQEMR